MPFSLLNQAFGPRPPVLFSVARDGDVHRVTRILPDFASRIWARPPIQGRFLSTYTKSMRRINSYGLRLLIVFVVLLAPLQSSYADDLSAAQTKLKELQKTIDLDNNYLNIEYSKNLDQTNQCIVKFTNAQEPEDQTKHNLCVIELERLQSDRERRLSQIALNSSEISKLTIEIAKLELASRPSAGAATANPSQSAAVPTPTVTPSAIPTPSTSSPAATSTASPAVATPQATPTPTQNSNPASTTQSPKPVSSSSPKVAQKASPAPKPVVKKKTIICAKGKVTKKVTAVKPVCPKGFKVQKNKVTQRTGCWAITKGIL